jgi:hypothetical protein
MCSAGAWLKSFIIWIVFEVLIVATAVVFITHIAIPACIMKDVVKIKKKLLHSINEYNRKVVVGEAGDESESAKFNATSYLFTSSRLARANPQLKQSKLILHFSTPWPHQSYQRTNEVSTNYSNKFAFLQKAA